MATSPLELSGLVTPEVCALLSEHASWVPSDYAIVELGSYKGKSACCLASGAQQGCCAHVWAIDPWDLPGNIDGRFGFAQRKTFEDFNAQVKQAGLREHITPIKGFSTEAARLWQGPKVGLLYIDGDHREKAVRADFNAWERHLTDGATVIFDDINTPKNPGVRVVVEELEASRRVHDVEVKAERLAVCYYAG